MQKINICTKLVDFCSIVFVNIKRGFFYMCFVLFLLSLHWGIGVRGGKGVHNCTLHSAHMNQFNNTLWIENSRRCRRDRNKLCLPGAMPGIIHVCQVLGQEPGIFARCWDRNQACLPDAETGISFVCQVLWQELGMFARCWDRNHTCLPGAETGTRHVCQVLR